MDERELTRRYRTNRSQINQWIWIARHALRQGHTRRALEATRSALWLMGA
jgi:cytochrome c-type biogenesis protein CcmH/NrfG